MCVCVLMWHGELSIYIYIYTYIYIYMYIYASCMGCKQRDIPSVCREKQKIVQDMDWVNYTEKVYPGEKYPESKNPDMFSTALICVTSWCNPSRKHVLASLFDVCSERLLRQQPSGGSLLRKASSPHICAGRMIELIGQITSEGFRVHMVSFSEKPVRWSVRFLVMVD